MRLQLQGVCKCFRSAGETVRAVDRLSLEVAAGEFVALYGPSGSGKTTLLLLVAAIMRPDEGRIFFDGREVSRLSAREGARYRRDEAGVVFQAFHLNGGASALDNAAMKLLARGMTLREAAGIARPWLERVGLGGCAARVPGELSMGERQRVAIARALAADPRLLVVDEPTGNLDSRRSREVLGLLCEIAHERRLPALLATHDPQAAAYVDTVYTMRDGRLSEGLDRELQSVVLA